MTAKQTNMAASVRQKLLNKAKYVTAKLLR
jgi:hypothetical protein